MKLCYNELCYNELGYYELGYNELGYNELGYMKLGFSEHLVITNEYFGPKCQFTTQIDHVITNPVYNEHIWPVSSYSLRPSFIVFVLFLCCSIN